MSVCLRQRICAILFLVMACSPASPAGDHGAQRPYYLDSWSVDHGVPNFWGDEDGDGVPNYIEFGYGTDPRSTAAGQGLDYVRPKIRINASGQAELVILQPDFPNNDGIPYGRHWFWISVYASTDLQNWEEIAVKPGANGAFFTREGYKVNATKRPAGDWEVVITEEQPASGYKSFRLSYYIVS